MNSESRIVGLMASIHTENERQKTLLYGNRNLTFLKQKISKYKAYKLRYIISDISSPKNNVEA